MLLVLDVLLEVEEVVDVIVPDSVLDTEAVLLGVEVCEAVVLGEPVLVSELVNVGVPVFAGVDPVVELGEEVPV